MKVFIRWLVAGLVTVATCAVVTWVCGALILPGILKDANIRWGVATALGLAAATLAGLWGQSFANQPAESLPPGDARTGRGRILNKITGGHFHGTVTQMGDFTGNGLRSNPLPLDPDPPKNPKSKTQG